VRKTHRWQVIFILLSFFVPAHSRFSAPSLPDSVFQRWCVPVWSQERMIVACSLFLPLSPPPSLPLSLSLSRERMRVSRLLTRPLSLFLSVIDTFSLLCPMFCSHCSKIFLSFPRFCLFLPPVCHMFTCTHCLHNMLFVFFVCQSMA